MHFKMLSGTCFNLDQFKILSSGNGLNPFTYYQNNKAADLSKFQAFADKKWNVIYMTE